MPRAARLLLLGCLALGLGGCLMLMKVPGMVDEMSELSVSGVVYYRYGGRTKYDEPYRVAYYLDADGKRRYRVGDELARTLGIRGALREGPYGVLFRDGRLLAAFKTAVALLSLSVVVAALRLATWHNDVVLRANG